MRESARKSATGGDLVKLHQRERPSSDRTANDVCTHLHGMWRRVHFVPKWERRLSGPLTHKHCCKASGNPPSTHRRRRFQLIKQRAIHLRGEGRWLRVCGVARVFLIFRAQHPEEKRPGPKSGFRFRFRFPFPVSVSVSGFRFRFPMPPFSHNLVDRGHYL